MKNVGAVVLAGDLRYSELPPRPIREGRVLVKVLSAALTPLDVAASRGHLPYAYGKIVGSAGLVRVLDLGYGVTNLVVGENAIVTPKCFVELALTEDGVMAEQTGLDARCLEPVPQSITSPTGLYVSLLAHLPSIISSLSGSSMLIAGCGYEATALARLVKDEIRTEAVCASEAGLRRVARLGIRAHLWEKKDESFDVVYVASLDPYVSGMAVRRCRETLYISPLVPRHLVSLGGDLKRIVSASQVRFNLSEALSIVRRVGQELEGFFRVVDSLKAVVESSGYAAHVAYLAPSEARRETSPQKDVYQR